MRLWAGSRSRLSPGNDGCHRGRPRLAALRLPPYAHELDPVEPVWAHLKRSLADPTKHNIAELIALVKARRRKMQHRLSDTKSGDHLADGLHDRSADPPYQGRDPG